MIVAFVICAASRVSEEEIESFFKIVINLFAINPHYSQRGGVRLHDSHQNCLCDYRRYHHSDCRNRQNQRASGLDN